VAGFLSGVDIRVRWNDMPVRRDDSSTEILSEPDRESMCSIVCSLKSPLAASKKWLAPIDKMTMGQTVQVTGILGRKWVVLKYVTVTETALAVYAWLGETRSSPDARC
jgi:hypothetical protein